MREYEFDGGFNLKAFAIAVAVLLLVSYGLFNARKIIMGPSIDIWNPVALETKTNENIIEIKGRVENANFLKANGGTITFDTEGMFNDKLLLSPGLNKIEIVATDRFKKEEKMILKIFYQEPDAEKTEEVYLINTGNAEDVDAGQM